MHEVWAVALLLSATSALFGTLVMRRIAYHCGIVNEPNPLVAQHVSPIAYLGGAGVLWGLLMTALFIDSKIRTAGVLSGVVLYVAMGLWDDVRPMSPRRKLVVQSAIAAACVAMGLHVSVFGHPAADRIFAALAIVILVNAVNITDVCDGLVGSLSIAVFLSFALFGPGDRVAAAICAGAFLGFLPFNMPRASIFLGDSGSHLSGFLITALALAAIGETRAAFPVDILLLCAAVPLFELIFVTCIRIAKGLPWWRGSPDHFALRLQAAGWARWQVSFVAGSLAFMLSSAGLLAVENDGAVRTLALVAALLVGGLIAHALLHGRALRRPN